MDLLSYCEAVHVVLNEAMMYWQRYTVMIPSLRNSGLQWSRCLLEVSSAALGLTPTASLAIHYTNRDVLDEWYKPLVFDCIILHIIIVITK